MWKEPHSVNYWPSAEQLASFWTHLLGELSFRTLLYYQGGKCRCWIEELLGETNITTTSLVWNQQTNGPYLKSQQNVDILGLVCLEADPFEPVLEALSGMLNQMREVPVLLQICSEEQDQQEIEVTATHILQRCQELLLPNVLLLIHDFFTTGRFYSYQSFPTFRLVPQNYQSILPLYSYKLGNLHGHAIRTQPTGGYISEPFTILTRDRNGTLVISGMLWRLMKEFAHHLNATLEVPFEPTDIVSIRSTYFAMLKSVLNGTIDITTTLAPFSITSGQNIPLLSYPVFVASWCTMLPVERLVSPREAMTGVMESPWTWLYLGIIYGLIRWLNERLLGRSILRLLPSLMHLTLICTILAQLSAVLIHPQQLNLISNFEQLKAEGMRIVGLRSEFNGYPENFRTKYATSFISYENFTLFDELRINLNSSNGYTISSLKWGRHDEMQNHFKRPLFRYSRDFCIQPLSLQALLLQENSLYRHELNIFLIRLRDSGLLMFWFSQGFYDMLRAGRVHLADLSTKVEIRPLNWMDWGFVVVLYAYVLAISLLVFVFELTVYYFNICLEHL